MDDPLFEAGGQDPNGPPPVSPKPNGTGGAGPGGGEDPRIAALQDQLSELRTSHTTLNETLQQLVGTLQRQARPSQDPAPAAPDDDDLLTQLSTHPKDTIAKIARGEVGSQLQTRDQVSGLLINTIHTNLLDDREFDVDNKFGEGAWTDVILPAIKPFLTQLRESNPAALADATTIQALVAKAIGDNFDTLADRRTGHEDASRKAEEERLRKLRDDISSQLPAAGLRRTARGDDDTGEIPGFDLYKREMAATGEKVNEAEFRRFHGMPNTLDAYLELQRADAAKRRGEGGGS